ncbi:hypothetical protein ACFOOP_19320 [Marinicaulis aureus]|uniref:Uncharacterized protein n=1 Tax=Hyphococcus aureus TaxID=2666033 RepID=A0ABW1KZD3_9PROT
MVKIQREDASQGGVSVFPSRYDLGYGKCGLPSAYLLILCMKGMPPHVYFRDVVSIQIAFSDRYYRGGGDIRDDLYAALYVE